MTSVLATRCMACGASYAVYVTKTMQHQVMALNTDDDEFSETAQARLEEAEHLDAEEQQSGEVDDARRFHERMDLHWLDARDGPGRCACGEPIDVLELLGHQIRHHQEGPKTPQERQAFADWYLHDRACQLVQRARQGYVKFGRGALGLWVRGPEVIRQYVDRSWFEEALREGPTPPDSSFFEAFHAYDPDTEMVVFFSWPDGAGHCGHQAAPPHVGQL